MSSKKILIFCFQYFLFLFVLFRFIFVAVVVVFVFSHRNAILYCLLFLIIGRLMQWKYVILTSHQSYVISHAIY